MFYINMYSNMKYYVNICKCLRVIQQRKNRKLKKGKLLAADLLKVSDITNPEILLFLLILFEFVTLYLSCLRLGLDALTVAHPGHSISP